MHEGIRKHLEDYLEGPRERASLGSVRDHLESCEGCRLEVEEMGALARLLRTLRASEEVAVAPGFYARVMQRIEARRKAPAIYAFLDPGFARRLIFACLAAAVGFGAYLIHAERMPVFGESNPLSIIAAQPPREAIVGSDPARDRDTVLISLASYRE